MADSTPLNVVYLNAHDMGRYIQPYGHPVETPNLQRFAEDAVVFRNAFCMGPTCSPSRAALLTGETPHQAGMLGLAHLGWGLHDYGRHWLHALHRLGYESHFTGGQHISCGGDELAATRRIGFQHIHEGLGQLGWAETARDVLLAGPAEPFYYEVGFADCHRHRTEFPPAGPGDDPRWLRGPACLVDEPRVREEFAGYRALARQFDHHIGMILGALEASGLAERTLVILTTDHGIDFPHMKCTLRDDGIGVFLMLRGPAGSAWRGGRVLESLVSHIDVFPTLCDLTGAPRPDWLQGRSLVPLVEGGAAEVREEIHAEVTYHAAYQPMRCVRTRRWKYIKRFYDHPHPVPPNEAPCRTREIWEAHGWFERVEPREELFDLVFDPKEERNLAGDPECGAVLEEMRRRLAAHLEATDDPIRHGHVALPPGGATVPWSDPSNHGGRFDAAAWNAWLAAHESRPVLPAPGYEKA
jgi:arylsulfatase A-like enzyme